MAALRLTPPQLDIQAKDGRPNQDTTMAEPQFSGPRGWPR